MTALELVSPWRQACAAALAHLPEMSHSRLLKMLNAAPPETIWERLAQGDLVPEALDGVLPKNIQKARQRWLEAGRRTEPFDVLEQCHARGVSVWTLDDDYPIRLREDPEPPAVLFYRGRPEALAHPTVAIIGTRHCTPLGRDLARRMGAELSEAGVSVVSGLALGIDGAAHKGALEAALGTAPIGVVGSGLEVPYPLRHRDLWADMGERGLLLSEAPLRGPAQPWRFPARNRIIAGLADLVVVVESHARGGSMITVGEAIDRSIEVKAVPGSIRSPASEGTNLLLRDGCAPGLDTEDVLVALNARFNGALTLVDHEAEQATLPVDDRDAAILDAVTWDPSSLDEILERLDLSLGEVAMALARLQQGGWVSNVDGFWRRS